MTVSHFAAFALIGWYLMVPPLVPGSWQVNQSAPRAQWTIVGTFEREADCLSAREHLRLEGRERAATRPRPGRGTGYRRWCPGCYAQCMATEDLRLKGR